MPVATPTLPLRARILAHHKQLKDFARRVGCSPQTVYAACRGARLSDAMEARFADGLGLTVAEFRRHQAADRWCRD